MFRPGQWVAAAIGRKWVVGLEIASVANLAVLAYVLKSDTYTAPWWWAVVSIVGQVLVLYVAKSLSESDREAKGVAERANTTTILHYKSATVGNIAHLLQALVNEEPERCTELQRSFLSNAVDAACEHLKVPRKSGQLTANWGTPSKDFTSWKVVAYDRNQPNRQVGRVREIAEKLPGASEAFLSGNTAFVADTMDASVAAHFDKTPPYRSILSIVPRADNVSQPHSNRTIGGRHCRIVGVLNIDCTDVAILDPSLETMLLDIAYIIAVLEHLKEGGQRGQRSKKPTGR